MKRAALIIWGCSLAWIVCAGVAVSCFGLCEKHGATLGAVSGLVALVGGTAGCVGVCASKED